MAVLSDDLTIQHIPCSEPVGGMSFRGNIRAGYHQLAHRFGPPDFPTSFADLHEAEASTLWMIDTPSGRVHLHTRLSVAHFLGHPGIDIDWSIHATRDSALPWMYKAVLGTPAAFPAGVPELSRLSTRSSLSSGYVDYLVQRMHALRSNAERLDSGSPDHRGYIELSRHTGNMALQVQQIMLHHEWANADDAERRRWTTLPMPQFTGEPELHQWHQWTRWTYHPDPTANRPEGGDPNLIGMLRTRLRDQVRFRDRVLTANKPSQGLDRKVELYTEHIDTLHSLIVTPLRDSTAEKARS